ncbi:MAG: TetR/AcrR family transcriptional regulator C-terminal domain-containing protein [Aquihabitans sp.]
MTSTKRAKKSTRQPLTPERISTEALRLVDDEGVDALTMRSLARRLGVEAMSIYHHIPSKDALLDGVVEQVLADLTLFDHGSGQWQDETRQAAHNFRDALLAHPNTVSLVATRRASAGFLRGPIEEAFGHLLEWGFSPDDAIDVLWTLNDVVIGNVITRDTASTSRADDLFGPWDPEEESRRFDRTLTLLIAGIGVHMAAESVSGP